MRFRFILSHEIEGSLEITEPDAWKDCVLKLDRHEEFHSLIEYFDGSFIFYGNNGIENGGIDFIKLIERNYGVDATILIDIDLTFDEIVFTSVFNGQFKLSDLEEMPNNKMRLPIIRDDFWAKFINRLDTPVDILSQQDIDGNERIVLTKMILQLPSQKIRKKADLRMDEDVTYLFDPLNQYAIIDWYKDILDELENKYSYPQVTSPTVPNEAYAFEDAGEYTIEIAQDVGRFFEGVGSGYFPTSSELDIYYRINNDSPVALTKTDIEYIPDSEYTHYSVTFTITVKPGDQLRVYGETTSGTIAMEFFKDGLTEGFEEIYFPGKSFDAYFKITADTIYTDTSAESLLIHDVGAAITDRIIGKDDSFYSEHLGGLLTQSRQYEENGCAWKYILSKGLQLRLYTLEEKPFFQSFNQWWKGINPILNLSLSYDTIDESQVIRVEHKQFEYQDEASIYISNVRQITRKYDNDKIFNKVEIGYTRWESEDISGIDDPQTKKTYSTRFKKVGKPVTIHSEFIAASLAIETTRRTTREKSADYKYDNETFIISINPEEYIESPDESPDLIHFTPELDENFSFIDGLLNAETRYNLRLTPARNFLRWQDYFQGGLQDYIGSEFKFASGQGNYDMTATMNDGSCLNDGFEGNELSEKGNIPVTNDFIHLALLYEIEIPLEWEEYLLIRDNRRKAIGISQTDSDHVPMFIKTLEYKPVKGTCTILAWAKEFLDLSQVPDTTPMQECYVSAGECEDALTDEPGDILTDELGVCITE